MADVGSVGLGAARLVAGGVVADLLLVAISFALQAK
jgi:hypothetical protein